MQFRLYSCHTGPIGEGFLLSRHWFAMLPSAPSNKVSTNTVTHHIQFVGNPPITVAVQR